MSKPRKGRAVQTTPEEELLRTQVIHNHPHVAQYYQSIGKEDVAFNLVRGLRLSAQQAVLGTGVAAREKRLQGIS
jgi:hypothetical protein